MIHNVNAENVRSFIGIYHQWVLVEMVNHKILLK